MVHAAGALGSHVKGATSETVVRREVIAVPTLLIAEQDARLNSGLAFLQDRLQ